MNTTNLFFKIFFFSGLVLLSSCKKDFLKEELKTDRGIPFYATDEGILQLATGTYHHVLKVPFSGGGFNGEGNFATTNYGTDEFGVGGDGSNEPWNNYDAGFRSVIAAGNINRVPSNWQWDNLYIGIGNANLLIENATASSSTSVTIKQVALGEGYFFRAYCYLRLISQYGGVPLKTKSSNTPEFEFSRATPEAVYKQIVDDFKQAYTLLTNTGGPARITKDAAAHYLAKAYLFRASEINDGWNTSTKAADLAAIIPLCDEVISRHPLAANYGDLWKYTKPDDANEKLPEIILSAQFTLDIAATGGNQQHLYWGSRYEDGLPMMVRDVSGDRPFSRLRTTYYPLRNYDLVNDSRFWKSFRTKYRVNNASGGTYTNGDLGLIFIINQPGDNRFSNYRLNNTVVYSKTGKTIPTAFIAFPAGITTDGALETDRTKFPPLSKYFDGSRLSVPDERGLRDMTLARSAETYLIAAEAKIRLAKAGTGSYADALPYINAVRARAEYKSGEDRSVYFDGGGSILTANNSGQNINLNAFFAENSYYESNNIPVTTAASSSLAVTDVNTFPASDEYIISKLAVTGAYERMLAFILNERSRELCGEYLRWPDLSRTKTLVPRAKTFNFQASPNIQEYHLLRAIPQTHLDAIRLNGKNLSPDQKQAEQNPGY